MTDRLKSTPKHSPTHPDSPDGADESTAKPVLVNLTGKPTNAPLTSLAQVAADLPAPKPEAGLVSPTGAVNAEQLAGLRDKLVAASTRAEVDAVLAPILGPPSGEQPGRHAGGVVKKTPIIPVAYLARDKAQQGEAKEIEPAP